MNDIYRLDILYEYKDEEYEFEDYCFLGLYSSREKAEDMIDFFRQKEKYIKYDIDNFIISKVYFIDRKQWAEGFISRNDMAEGDE